MAILYCERPEYAPYRGVAKMSPFAKSKLMSIGVLHALTPIYRLKYMNVHGEENIVRNMIYRTYHTPVGSVRLK